MQISKRALVLVVLSIASSAAGNNDTIGDQSEFYSNYTEGSKLWSGILRDCKTASFSCIQKNVYHYLDDTFRYQGDITIGNFVSFKQNQIDYNKYSQEANEVEDDEEEERAMSPLEEVTRALQNQSVGFLMTHDTEIKLPDTLFEGSTLKVSPRAFEGEGVLVKLDLIPKQIPDNAFVGQGRIFFKKIKKFFKNKLVTALMSILLVISLVKSLLMFFMPLVVGVGTAKKILLKVLLFVFPALSHLFKLCTYYHDSYHGTKYHHHHHQIAHIHHLPSLHHSPPETHYPPSGPPGHKYEHESFGPPGHKFEHESFGHPGHKFEHDNFEFSGPGLGPEYISTHRNAFEHTPSKNDEKEITSWGLGQGQKGVRRGHKPSPASPGVGPPHSATKIEELTLQAEREVMLKTRLQQEQQRIRQENIQLQEQLKQELKIQEQLKLQAMMLAQQKTKLHPQVAHHSVQQVQQIMQPKIMQPQIMQPQIMQPQIMQPPSHMQPHPVPQLSHQPQILQAKVIAVSSPVYDAFYTPILEKIDKIFNSIGIGEEQCRERLVCSMYKNPLKFSPHSNLLSAELSRDSKDLQKPTASNEAVVRFYRYVQAARDGQDQRECLRLYPTCNINTEL